MKYSEPLRRELTNFQQLVERLMLELDQDTVPGDFRAAIHELRGGLNDLGRAAFMSLVSCCEETAATIGAETGIVLRYKQTARKEWLTWWGPVTMPRRLYQADRGGGCRVPLDERCGMVDRYLTVELERAAVFLGAQLPLAAVAAALAELLPQAPSCTALQHLLTRVGERAESQATAVEATVQQQAPLQLDGEVLVVGWDGTTVPLREAAPRRGRPAERPGVRDTPAAPTAWREGGVGMVATYRAARDLERETATRVDVRYFARMPEPKMATLITQVVQQTAVALAAGDFAQRVLLADGKREIWRTVDRCPGFDGFTQIVDFYHASEHLSHAAEALFGKGTDHAERWYRRWRHKLKHQPGAVAALQRSLHYHQQHLSQRSARAQAVAQQRRYFRHNQHRMAYAHYRALGLPIGSGPLEAACKTIFTQRLKRSGMRWSRAGGQQILNLRVPILSQRWEAFWNWYLTDSDQLAKAA